MTCSVPLFFMMAVMILVIMLHNVALENVVYFLIFWACLLLAEKLLLNVAGVVFCSLTSLMRVR